MKHEEKILSIDLRTFGDASGKGVSAAVYAVVEQPSGVNQGLVTAKSWFSKKGLTIPRLELVSRHMATKQVVKACSGCKRFQAAALAPPPSGLLPTDRTEGYTPFEVIGVDFARLLKYRVRSNREGKPILHCAHAVSQEDYSWRFYQTWRRVNF